MLSTCPSRLEGDAERFHSLPGSIDVGAGASGKLGQEWDEQHVMARFDRGRFWPRNDRRVFPVDEGGGNDGSGGGYHCMND